MRGAVENIPIRPEPVNFKPTFCQRMSMLMLAKYQKLSEMSRWADWQAAMALAWAVVRRGCKRRPMVVLTVSL